MDDVDGDIPFSFMYSVGGRNEMVERGKVEIAVV
jgi:hypothetical protein